MTHYLRPIAQVGLARPASALSLAAGWCWFDQVEILERARDPVVVPVGEVDPVALKPFVAPRAMIAGLVPNRPNLMGILNATPDSFSDGGKFNAPDVAVERALNMIRQGANIIDIGGESTRPGADYVEADEEIARTAPIIAALRAQSDIPVSIDTRKAPVAQAALDAGASLVNDVYAFTHDPDLADVAANKGAPVCLMHAQGDPKVMQAHPEYDDVVLDVYDFLAERVDTAIDAGISRDNIMIDPGIGFGKTLDHNLALLQNLTLFHGLGLPVLLGASRKRFIGAISGEENAEQRVAGSVAVTLQGLAQGVQIHRVHDIAEQRQAVALWMAMTGQKIE